MVGNAVLRGGSNYLRLLLRTTFLTLAERKSIVSGDNNHSFPL